MLDSLRIKNFRSLQDLEIARLGRVNLLVGKNNSGKSTVLEALRLYAGNAQRPLLEAIAQEHNERASVNDTDALEADSTSLPFQGFFTGRRFPSNGDAIEIGSASTTADRLSLSHGWLQELSTEPEEVNGELVRRTQRKFLSPEQAADAQGDLEPVIVVRKGERVLPPIGLNLVRRGVPRLAYASALPCSVIPTQFIPMEELALAWDDIVLTEREEVVKKALRLIEPHLENLAFVQPEAYGANTPALRTRLSRTAMVKLKDTARPVPLNSMGDGMVRVLQLALKVYSAKGGFLLIDEFENGLHYSVQKSVWNLLFELAEQHNIQVFATTHSWDCIESFTQVAVERKQTDGYLFRMGRSQRTSDQGRIIATAFDESALAHITQTDMEVR